MIDEWFDYYNNDRPIWGLGKRTPIEYYEYLKSGGTIIAPKKYHRKKNN